jgi:hypothetical protein
MANIKSWILVIKIINYQYFGGCFKNITTFARNQICSSQNIISRECFDDRMQITMHENYSSYT